MLRRQAWTVTDQCFSRFKCLVGLQMGAKWLEIQEHSEDQLPVRSPSRYCSELSNCHEFRGFCQSHNSVSGPCQAVSLLAKHHKWKKTTSGSSPMDSSSLPILCWRALETLCTESLLLGQEQSHMQTCQANAPWLAHAAQDHLLRWLPACWEDSELAPLRQRS